MKLLIYKNRRFIIAWLSLCLLLVAAMVVLGGYTRLSGSGLSITQWKPVHGVIPPLSEVDWWEEFQMYRLSPQYEKINRGMSLDEFKDIFWPEYFHRLLGRMVGLAFFIPLLIFAIRRSISKQMGFRLLGIFLLGGLQGFIGWFMVQSGLVDNPHVSHLRLALHLSLAFAIGGLILWTLLGIVASHQSLVSSTLVTSDLRLATYILWFSLLCLQIILGAFTAGLHGGLIYNTWPLMNGEWLPALGGEPWHENLTLIQFLHRRLAELLAGGFLLWWYLQREHVKTKRLGKLCAALAGVIFLQFALGVATLLHQAPLGLALLHQLTALVLFGMAVTVLYYLRHCEERSDEVIQTGSPRAFGARDDGE